jgi:hypothetical protein
MTVLPSLLLTLSVWHRLGVAYSIEVAEQADLRTVMHLLGDQGGEDAMERPPFTVVVLARSINITSRMVENLSQWRPGALEPGDGVRGARWELQIETEAGEPKA